MNEDEFIYVKKKIREFTDFDLDNYGHNQMIRRLDGYISRYKFSNVAQFCNMIKRDKNELEKLQKFLTINVSEFFRDPVQFEILREQILPGLLRDSLKISIWSAGCSNGAEAFTIAILLDRLSPYREHQILATDVDKKILTQAAAGGPFKTDEIKNVPKGLVGKYFKNDDGVYWVIDRIRRKVTFKLHDLTQDSYGENFNLIICRNVVIYFSREMKKVLRKKFLAALKPNGVLFIGATETMLDIKDNGFERLSACFYRKKVDDTEKIWELAISGKGEK